MDMGRVLSKSIPQCSESEKKRVNRVFHFAMLALFLCAAAGLPALGKKDGINKTAQEERSPVEREEVPVESVIVQVSGRVRLVGSGPFPDIVITGPEKEWYIDRAEAKKLWDYQQRTVTVEGAETVLELTFASGVPAGRRRILKDVSIIEVSDSEIY